jgi:hypothetical protein
MDPGDSTLLGDLELSAAAGSRDFEFRWLLTGCVPSLCGSVRLEVRPCFDFGGVAPLLKLLLKPPRLNALPSDCRLKASNSGF